MWVNLILHSELPILFPFQILLFLKIILYIYFFASFSFHWGLTIKLPPVVNFLQLSSNSWFLECSKIIPTSEDLCFTHRSMEDIKQTWATVIHPFTSIFNNYQDRVIAISLNNTSLYCLKYIQLSRQTDTMLMNK